MSRRHTLIALATVVATSLSFCATATAEPLDAAETRLEKSGVSIERLKMAIYPDVKKTAKATDFAAWAARKQLVMVLLLAFDSEADAKSAPPLLKKWHDALCYHSQVIVTGKDVMIVGTATPKEPKPDAKLSIAALIKAFKSESAKRE